MRNETPVTVVGTLVKTDKGRRVGDDQAMVLNLRVAANERRFDRTAGQWVDGDTLYLRVNCWRTLAENASTLLVGDPVIVSGKLRTKEWLSEDGDRRSQVELEASALGPNLARCSVTGLRKPRREERLADTDAADAPVAPEADSDFPGGDSDFPGGDSDFPGGDSDFPGGDSGLPGGDEDVSAGDEPINAPLSELADGARPLTPAST